MIVNLNFNLETWIKHFQLEALSEDDAKQKLLNMSLADIFSNETLLSGSDTKITEITTEIVEYDLLTEVSNIKYDLSTEDMDAAVISYLENFLPKKLTISLTGIRSTDDVESLIEDEILGATGYTPKSFEFQIIRKK